MGKDLPNSVFQNAMCDVLSMLLRPTLRLRKAGKRQVSGTAQLNDDTPIRRSVGCFSGVHSVFRSFSGRVFRVRQPAVALPKPRTLGCLIFFAGGFVSTGIRQIVVCLFALIGARSTAKFGSCATSFFQKKRSVAIRTRFFDRTIPRDKIATLRAVV